MGNEIIDWTDRNISLVLENSLNPSGQRMEFTTTTNWEGFFEFLIASEEFSEVHKGDWQLTVEFSGDEPLLPSKSESYILPIRGKRGYAILVQGAFLEEGAEEHLRTLNFVKKVLMAGGKGILDSDIPEDDDIYEIYSDGEDDYPCISTEEAIWKNKLEYAITTWAKDKMEEAAAPLYIVLVGHGQEGKFFMSPDPGFCSMRTHGAGSSKRL